MNRTRTVVLDNEAVQALLDVGHRKHRRLLGHVQVVVQRKRRCPSSIRLVVPTAVRVEAGWDRQARRAAMINRLHVDDAALDAGMADRAVRARTALGVTVADGHIAAVLGTMPGPHAVITSDAGDVHRIGRHLNIPLNVIEV